MDYTGSVESKESIRQINQMCLMDDTLMVKCFENSPECTELLLRLILKRKTLHVESVRSQLRGNSIGLDIFATDDEQLRYNIKVLRDDTPLSGQRIGDYLQLLNEPVRYNTGPSTEVYIIYIQEHSTIRKAVSNHICCVDFFGMYGGRIMHIVCVNGDRKNRSPLGQLMMDFSCTDPSDMNYTLLADRMRYFKEDPVGIQEMREILQMTNRL